MQEEYAAELGGLDNERWYLAKYRDTLFQFTVSPLGGYEMSKYGNESGHRRWWGFKLWGSYSDYFGAPDFCQVKQRVKKGLKMS